MENAIEFSHQPERQRFIAAEDGVVSSELNYAERADGTLDYRRTYTPPEHRGRGIASRLVRHALDWALANERKVVPSCPFVAVVLDADSRYAELRA